MSILLGNIMLPTYFYQEFYIVYETEMRILSFF